MLRHRAKLLACLAIALSVAWWLSGFPGVAHERARLGAGMKATPSRSEGASSVATASAKVTRAVPDRAQAGVERTTLRTGILTDAEAASRAYAALKLCVDANDEREWFDDPRSRAMLDACSRSDSTKTFDPACPLSLDRVAAMFDRHERARTECVGMETRLRDGSIYAVARRAAELGDRNAAACYVLMRWNITEAQARDPGFRGGYDLLAPRLIEEGIAAGDWRMVRLARAGSEHPMSRNAEQIPLWRLSPGILWLEQLAEGPNPERTVALLRLMQAGAAEPEWIARYGALVDRYEKRLTPGQSARASAWADRTSRTAFGGRRDLRHEPRNYSGCD